MLVSIKHCWFLYPRKVVTVTPGMATTIDFPLGNMISMATTDKSLSAIVLPWSFGTLWNGLII